MSRTLFWYIFLDLFKIFMMTSGALAGIMSFGGMLKPLMSGGLDAGQVAKILGYLSPAMSAYSFPIAALFAATVVYGRLSADNEIVAARAGGISFFSLAVPALVLGLLVSLWSILFLCFVVPNFTLKVEKVIYSNTAQIVANMIAQNHQMKIDSDTYLYAQEAIVLPSSEDADEQQLVLVGPMFVHYDTDPNDSRLRIPTDFYPARQATAYIRQNSAGGAIQFTFTMQEGMRLPRSLAGQATAGIRQAQFGPITAPSLIKDNTKFMVLKDLQTQLKKPWKNPNLARMIDKFVTEDQQAEMARLVQKQLHETARLNFVGQDETYLLSVGEGTVITNRGTELTLSSPADAPSSIALKQMDASAEPWQARCHAMTLRFDPVGDHKLININLRMDEVSLTVGGETSLLKSFPRGITVAMPPAVQEIESYRTDPARYRVYGPEGTKGQIILSRQMVVLRHDIISELHGRAAFAISCLVLVVVGCVMGMMFKSGNFLTAFAVSFVPALFCITMIIAGQRTAGTVGWSNFWHADGSLQMGIALIWSGVGITGALGAGLLWRMQRT
jgi:lipopolysaccharide export LptBFGC system permease protein LptF